MRILWIPHTGWHIPQRAHLFCRALAERHEVHVTDWVADFSKLSDYLSRRYLRNFRYRQYRDGKIRVHGIPRISPALPLRTLRRINYMLFSRIVRSIIDEYAIDVVVGTFVVPPPSAPRVVFDLFDENVAKWRNAERFSQYANEIEQIEWQYMRDADAVVAASSVLADKVRKWTASELGSKRQVHLIPNGIDLALFNGNSEIDRLNIRQKIGVKGKLVGSIGNHDNLSELTKILDSAKILSEEKITFLIAGRGIAVPAAQKYAAEQNLSNVIFRGYVPPDEATKLSAALDVGLCPYEKSAMDDARSPMRLLMYMGASVPVVCTDLEEVRRMGSPNVVLVDDRAEAFAEGIRQALQCPRKQPAQIQAYDLRRVVSQYEAVLQGSDLGDMPNRDLI